MKPLTLAVCFGAVAWFAATTFNKWADEKAPELERTAQACQDAKPFTQAQRNTPAPDPQRSMLKAGECAHGMVTPVGAAAMKQQGIDPSEAIGLFKKLQNEAARKE